MPVFFYILLIHSLHFYYRLFLVAGAVCCLCDLDVLTFSETIPFYSPTPCFFILYFILFPVLLCIDLLSSFPLFTRCIFAAV